MPLTDAWIRRAQEAGGVATFDIEIETGRALWLGDFRRLLDRSDNGPQNIGALLAMLDPQEQAVLLDRLKPSTMDDGAFAIECRIGQSTGEARCTLLRGQALRNDKGQVRHLIGVAIDVANSKIRQSGKHEVESAAELALRAGHAGFWTLDPKTGDLAIDARARAILRLPEGPLRNEDILERIHPDDREQRRLALSRALDLRRDGYFELEYRLIATDGQPELWIESRGQRQVIDGEPQRLVGVLRDITARKREEELFAESKARLEARVAERTRQLEAIVDSAVNAILTINVAGVIQTANHSAVRLFGYALDELLGRNVRMLMPEPYSSEHDQYLKNYLDTGRKRIIGVGREVTGKRKDGSTFPVHLAVSEFEDRGARYFTGIITDLTDREAADKALRESQAKLADAHKMDAIGQLTGGVAHDFNNLLTVIMGNLELLDMRLEDETARDLIHRADEAARMGARLTERLLTFSRRRKLQPSVINLNDVTLGMIELLRRSLGETIAVDANLAPDLWNARIDASEIENTILNLAINARDAMPAGGRILIETNNLTLAAEDSDAFGDLPAGDFVKLSVSDTGDGMPPEVVSRAFEPFFTTKEAGRGTGLGLSTIYGFVKQSGGDARIYSEVGKGTTVSLYLPRDANAVSTMAAGRPVAETPTLAVETILVVEDNEQVRDLTIRRLGALGYETLVAETGPAAIALIEKSQNVDLVFSDVVMPGGMSGFDVASWVKKNRPEIRVLLTSGFAPEIAGADASNDTPLLRKPYAQSDLARALRTALQQPR